MKCTGTTLAKGSRIALPDDVRYRGVPYAVTAVGESALGGRTVAGSRLPAHLDSIASYAFRRCVFADDLVLPSTLRVIGRSAFEGCDSLAAVVLPEGLQRMERDAFKDCASLRRVTLASRDLHIPYPNPFSGSLPLSVRVAASACRIPARMFANLLLEALEFDPGSQLEEIGEYAFARSYNRPDTITAGYAVRLPESVRLVSPFAFQYSSVTDLTLPVGLDSIGDNAFSYCEKLKSVYYGCAHARTGGQGGRRYVFDNREGDGIRVTIGREVQHVPDRLFYYAYLSSLTFEAGSQLQTIGKNAFTFDGNAREARSYSSLGGELLLPEGLRSVGEYAFCHAAITRLTLPASLRSIGDKAFYYCYNLAAVNLNASELEATTKSRSGVVSPFSSAGLAVGGYALHVGPEVTTIPEAMFRGGWDELPVVLDSTWVSRNYGVRSLTWSTPCAVDSIGASAFTGGPLQGQLTLPSSVRAVGAGAFSGCKGLDELTIGAGVKKIGRSAFARCGMMNRVTYLAPEVEDYASMFAVNADTIRELHIGREVRALPAEFMRDIRVDTLVFERGSQLAEIGDKAFYTDSLRASLTGLEHLRRIGTQAFYNARVGGELRLTDALKIGKDAFIPGRSVFSRLDLDLTTTAAGDSLKRWGVRLDGALHVGPSMTVLQKNMMSGSKVRRLTFDPACQLDSICDGALGCDYRYTKDNPLEGTLSLPSTVRYIGAYNFNDSKIQGRLVLPDALEELAGNAFSACKGLTELVVPDGLKTIGAEAFKDCELMAGHLVVPAATTYIGAQAFSGTAFTRLTLEDGDSTLTFGDTFNASGSWVVKAPRRESAHKVTVMSGLNINKGQFAEMPLTTAYIGRNVSYRCGSVQQLGIAHNYYSPFSCSTTLRSVRVGEGVTRLLPYQLAECVALETAALPSTLREVREGAFQSDSALARISLPDSVAYVFKSGFAQCAALERVYLGTGMKSVGTYAFFGCESLKQVDCAAEKVPSVSGNTFEGVNVPVCRLRVPLGAKPRYASAYVWRDFDLGEEDFTPVEPVFADTADGNILTPEAAMRLQGQWYDLGGRRLAQPRRGLNLLRTPEGQTRKVLVR